MKEKDLRKIPGNQTANLLEGEGQTCTQALDKEQIKASILSKLQRNFGSGIADATVRQLYNVLAHTVRDEVMARNAVSKAARKEQRGKVVYYMSAEFLVGRALHNNMVSLLNEPQYMEALEELGIDKSIIFEEEPEPGLGNGGLGRLAACFLDSLSTLKLPAVGSTIRYEYGLFRQKVVDGYQVELPDNWLEHGNIWEIPRPNDAVEVRFNGHLEEDMEDGRLVYRHLDYTTVQAVPFDMPIVGYDSCMVNQLRTWSARSTKSIDMQQFNQGLYTMAMEEKELAEVISKVLYPEDNHYQGKELRLKQQYFLSSATIQYALNSFEKKFGDDWALLPSKVAFHVNDTHPGMAIPELMRILVDEKHLEWEEAERITRRCFAYTNHTVMQEALEKWSEDLVRSLLPRIYMILQELNRRQCEFLWNVYPGQWERIGKMAIISYGQIQMANLCVYFSHTVNGVSQIHTDILRKQTFRDYYNIQPSKFIAITNGITHRRWLMQSNPGLSALLDEAIGLAWRKDPQRLQDLQPLAQDAAFQEKFAQVKEQNKQRLAEFIERNQGIVLHTDAIIDVQAKRLHEYKRQLMNILSILMLYNRIVANPNYEIVPRTFIFAAKAAPGYYQAKLIIKLINTVSKLVENHPRARQMIQIIFMENYNVSAAEVLMPAANLSEQISTAGKEASGTGNMKFMMNGALTIGTLDGANVEISQAVGRDNIYIFGLTAQEVEQGYGTYKSFELYETNAEIRQVMEQLIDGSLNPENPRIFQELYHALLFGDGGGMADPYFVIKDMPAYASAQSEVQKDYLNPSKWWRMAITNTAQSGYFSSDRSISEYNEKIWKLDPLNL